MASAEENRDGVRRACFKWVRSLTQEKGMLTCRLVDELAGELLDVGHGSP